MALFKFAPFLWRDHSRLWRLDFLLLYDFQLSVQSLVVWLLTIYYLNHVVIYQANTSKRSGWQTSYIAHWDLPVIHLCGLFGVVNSAPSGSRLTDISIVIPHTCQIKRKIHFNDIDSKRLRLDPTPKVEDYHARVSKNDRWKLQVMMPIREEVGTS
jgi:hypothetical protein